MRLFRSLRMELLDTIIEEQALRRLTIHAYAHTESKERRKQLVSSVLITRTCAVNQLMCEISKSVEALIIVITMIYLQNHIKWCLNLASSMRNEEA